MNGRLLVAVALLVCATTAQAARSPRLDALRADAIASHAAKAYVSTSVAPADRPLNVVHTQLAHIGPRLVWVVDLELPQRTDCHRPGVYSYCVPSFLPPGHLLVTVDDATGRVRHVSRS